MKCKIGFVTNSSSSNFLIIDRRKKKSEDIEDLELEVTIKVSINQISDESHVIRNIKELDEYFEEYPYLKEENYNNYKKEIEAGNVLYEIELSNNDGGISSAIYYSCQSDWYAINKCVKLPKGIEIKKIYE